MKKIACLTILCGCMVGPHYQKPEIIVPEQFQESKGADSISDEDLCSWWKQFEDPLLDALIEEAVAGNFEYLIALEQVASARAEYQVQGSYLWPQIDLNAVAIRERFSQNIFSNPSNTATFAAGQGGTQVGAIDRSPLDNFFQLGFDAIWELDLWGALRRAKLAAFEQWEKSQFIADGILISVIGEVARDYLSIRSLQQQIKLLSQKIRADERILQLTQFLFEAGLSQAQAVQKELSALDSDQAQIRLLESSLKQMIYTLAIVLGKQPEMMTDAFAETHPLPDFLGKIPAGLPADLLRRRPDIRAAERQLAAATEQIGIAMANLFPTVTLTGNGIGGETDQIHNLFQKKSQYWSIGPNINWNLIDFGLTRGQINLANSLQKQAFLSYEKTVISALQDVEGALVAFFEEQKRVIDLSEKVSADARSFNLNRDLFQAGLISEIEELETMRVLIDSETILVQSEQTLGINLVALYKAMGGDWECTSTP